MKLALVGTLVLAVILTAATVLTFAGQATAPANGKVLKDIPYAKPGGKPVMLDLYLPNKAEGPLPVIMYIHGGAWKEGGKVSPTNPTNWMMQGLIARGYAVASVEYRFSQEAIFPAQIHDCKAAVRWVRAHAKEYNLDGAHVGAWGDSAGGHLVALMGTAGGVKEMEGDEDNLDQSSRLQAVCDWFGPTDFTTPGGLSASPIVTALLGGSVRDNPDKAKAASPMTYVSKDAPPFLIMHGDKDTSVAISQSETFAAALKKAGVDVTYKVIAGQGHGFNGAEVAKMVGDFFDKYLKAPAAAAPPKP
jgi:acetyl esterase/lipase